MQSLAQTVKANIQCRDVPQRQKGSPAWRMRRPAIANATLPHNVYAPLVTAGAFGSASVTAGASGMP